MKRASHHSRALPPSILIAGSAAYDHFYDYEGSFLDGFDMGKLADLSVSFSVSNYRMHEGGAGANIAWSLALLKQPNTLFSAVGTDGGPYLERLRDAGVCVDAMTMHATARTPEAVITTDKGKRQITLFDPGVEMAEDQPRTPDIGWPVTRAIVAPRKPKHMLPVMHWCRERGIPCIFDPGQHILDFSRAELTEALELSSGLTVNEYEWHLFRERTEMSKEDVIAKLDFVIVTLAEKGFLIHQRDEGQTFPCCTPYDLNLYPTGAGDGFRAGFLYGWERGWDLTECGKLGAALASKVVEYEGAQLPSLDLQEIWTRAEKAYGAPLPEPPIA